MSIRIRARPRIIHICIFILLYYGLLQKKPINKRINTKGEEQ